MPVLSIAQALAYGRKAGFSGDGLITMIAICMAESGLNTHPLDNTAGNSAGRDRGLVQFNSYYHPEVSDACAYDPQCSLNAAYKVTKGGTDFYEWSTWASGKYKQYLSQIASANTGVATPIVGGLKPWYTYPRFDNLGGAEPFGPFPKPDSNIQIPANYPVTALLPGTVTAVDGGEVAWGAVVTIRLDQPLNALATHTAYLHLRNSVVNVGQHVKSNQLIGYNGLTMAAGSQKVPLGFALYHGDHYGQGAGWALMTTANLATGLLNPVPLLDAARKNGGPVSGGGGADFSNPVQTVKNVITTGSQTAHDLIVTVPGFSGMCEALDAIEQFTPFTMSTQADKTNVTDPINWIQWGIDLGTANPGALWADTSNLLQGSKKITQLPSDAMQATLIFIVSNSMAVAVRGLFVLAGIILFYALIINVVTKNVDVKDIAGVAQLAA